MAGSSKLKIVRALCLMASIAPSAMAYAQVAQPQVEGPVEDIVVTGSRVVANGNNSPTPVTVVSVEQMQAVKPGTVADQLNELPQFSNSQGQTAAAGGGSANAGNPSGQGNVLNLRNFGFTRNLVLYDGHRVAPNSPNGTVDIDIIPQLLLKRVDVVTGGASAVYGSDAVTGVVNFITDTSFKGLKVNGQAGISSRGDGGQQAIGAAWGTDIGERGHFMASYEYRNDEGVDSRAAREWGRNRYHIGTVSTANGITTQRLVANASRPVASFGGTIASIGAIPNFYNDYYFSSPGVLTPVDKGTFVNSNVAGNGSGSYFNPSIKGALEMHQAYARFDYDLTDDVHFYARGAYTSNHNAGYAISNPTYSAATGSNSHPVFLSNPYLPDAIEQKMRDGGLVDPNAVFGINKVHSGPNMDQYRQFTESFGKNYSIDTGFNGNFGDGWKYELAYVRSKNSQKVRQNNAINGRKLAAALDAVETPNGIQCYVTTQAAYASMYQGCVPYASIFGPTMTQAEADWLFDPLQVTTTTRMDDVEGFVSGSPFDTWAGPVTVALSGQWRKLSYKVDSSTTPATLTNPLNCAGLRLINCTPTSLEYFQAESLSRPKVSVNVKEVAFETQVPLLKDSFVGDLSLNGAYRLTDYSTSGSVSSWKVGVDWALTDSLRFRGTRSRDIRAPTMHELFAPQTVGSFNGRDELLQVALDGVTGRPSPAGAITSGNTALRPELADTLTLGVVYQPEFARGLSIALDYFDIKVKDAIINVDGALATSQLDCINSGGASETCQLIVRAQGNCCTNSANYANAIVRTFSRPINIGRQYTRGADFEVSYVNEIFSRPISMRALLSYQPKNVLVDSFTGLETNVAGSAGGTNSVAGHSKWRGTLLLNMDVTEDVRVSLQERWRGKLNWYPTYKGTGAPQYVLLGAPKNVPDRFYTNLNVSFKTGPAEFYVNVQNLFDTKPAIYANPNSPFPGSNGVAPGDDAIGRYFTAGFRIRM